MAKVQQASPVAMRPLSDAERGRAFAKAGYSLGPYVETVREMEGGIAYAFTLNGLPASALKRRLNRAAASLSLQLRWAPAPRDARELIGELSE